MATCPNCGTENKKGAPFCVNCRKPLPKKLKRISSSRQSPTTVEQIPQWLTLLLTKYGESSGPLAGLTAEPVLPQEEPTDFDFTPRQPDVEEAELSALLDQMAQEGPSQLTEERLSTSVEWGAYGDTTDEPLPPPIDDVLAGMGTGQDQAPLYDDQPPGVETEAGDIEIPDWLSDSPPPASETVPGYEASDQPEAGASFDIPDWLSDETPAVEESNLSPIQKADVPDWLTASPAVDQPPVGASTEQGTDRLSPASDPAESAREMAPPPDSTSADHEDMAVPDWLLDELDKPTRTAPLKTPPESPEEPAADQPPAESDTELDRSTAGPEPSLAAVSPDWLDELPPTDLEGTDVEEPELAGEDVPDWLSDMPAPIADEPEAGLPPQSPPSDAESADWSVPDWIAAEMTDEEEEELKTASAGEDKELPDWLSGEEPVGPEEPSFSDIPDWLADDSVGTQEPSDTPDEPGLSDEWLAGLDPDATEEGDTTASEAVLPPDTDWLADYDGLDSEADTPAGEESIPPPGTGWLRDLDILPGQEPADETSSFDVPDWLTDLGTSTDEETAEQIASVEGPPADVAEPDFEVAPETEMTFEDETPPAPLEEPPALDIDKGPAFKLKKLKPLKRLPKKPTTPDWVTELVPPEQPPPGAEEQSPPDWITGLVPPTAAQVIGPVRSSVPDWAQDLVPRKHEITTDPAEGQSPEPVAPLEETPEIPVFEDPDLSAESVPEDRPAEEPVDWIAQFSPAADVETPVEEAGWPADDDEIAAEEDDSLLSDRLDWLMASEEMEPAAPPPGPGAADEVIGVEIFPEDSEIPGWLEAEQEETPGGKEISVPSSSEEELPDWLTDLDEAPAGEEDTPYAIEEEEEIPDWLADLPEILPDEMPDWMTQPDEATVEETEVPDQVAKASQADIEAEVVLPVISEGDEIPEWLTELPEAPAEDAAAIGEEPEIPDWLAMDKTSVEEGQAAVLAGAEEEIPDWLTELPEVLVEEEAISSVEAEDETPDWLAELPEVPAEEEEERSGSSRELPPVPVDEEPSALSAPTETEELPDWLTDLPEAPGEEMTAPAVEETETPDWLAELPDEFDEAETPEGLLAEGTYADEQPESPDRVIEPEVSVTAEPSELPEWMSDLGELPAKESASLPTLDEETLPAAVEKAPPIEEEPPEVPEWLFQLEEVLPADTDSEMPDWLTELGESSPVEVTTASPPPEAEETPEWLADVSATPAQEPPPIEAETEPPDWLAGFRQMPAVEEEGETSDWLKELPEAPVDATSPAPTGTELPARLTEPDTEPPVEEASSIVQEEEAPDWLAGSPEAPVEETPPDDDQEKPESGDWLANMRQAIPFEEEERSAGGASESPETPVSPAAPEEDETPPWLAEIAETTAAEQESPRPSPEETSEWPVEETSSPSPTEEGDELPEWLAELPEAPDEKTSLPPASPEEGADIPDWLAETAESSIFFEETLADEESIPRDEASDWLGEPPGGVTPPRPTVKEDEQPDWLAGLPETPTGETTQAESPEVLDQPAAPLETEPAAAEGETAEDANWLAEFGEEDNLVLPDWLSEPPEGIVKLPEVEAKEDSPASLADPQQVDKSTEANLEETLTEEPDIPDWLAGATGTTTDETFITPPKKKEDPPPEGKEESGKEEPPPFSGGPGSPGASRAEIADQAKAGDSPDTPAAAKSWWGGVQSAEPDVEEDDSKIAESTGVLTGLSGMLPAQKIMSGATVTHLGPVPLEGQKDAVLAAAHEFHAIATAVPQPATLPAPVSRRDRLIKGAIRTGLYLVFIILIALPLLPGLQKVADLATGRRVPWTEPVGNLSEVLDRQRRELISTELGIIDFQQPDSVALVSFDYTPATQGELQPLAEAVLGRLRGQGMRLIFVSLQPEGAVLAQRTLESLLDSETDEQYGTRMVNLGYLPGQITAVRELAAGRSFGTFSDYESDSPFSQIQSTGWTDVQNIGQVDVMVNLTDNPTTARWWVEQMETAIEPDDGERYLVAATSVTADPFLRPYRNSEQLDGLVSGINGAAAIEAGRKNFGPARKMLDSQSIAHLLIVILIAAGTMAGWMPAADESSQHESQSAEAGQSPTEKVST